MRRTQVKLITLSAALVAALTAVSLGVLGLIAENWQWPHFRADRAGLASLAGIILLQDALLAAALYALFRRVDLRALRNSIDLMTRRFHTQVAALQQSETVLSTALNAVPFPIFWKNLNGAYEGCNDAFVKIAGLHYRSDVVGKTDFDLPWAHESAERYRAEDREVVASGRPLYHLLDEARTAGDTRIWVDATKVPLINPANQICGVLGVSEVITERKRAEDAALRERAFNDAMLSGLPGVVCLYDEQGRLVRWSRKVTEASGYSAAELNVRHVLDWFPPDQRDRAAAATREVMQNGHAELEADLVTKAGRRVPYYSTGIRLTIEGKTYLLTIGIDITERKRAEEALRREKAVTDAVFDNVPAVLALYEEDGRLVRWNRKTREIIGFSDGELAGRHVGDNGMPEERARIAAAVRQAMTDGHAVIETTLVTKRGDHIPYFYTGVRVRIDGRPHLLSIGVDISDRKRAEQDLRNALDRAEEAIRAKDRFLAAVSHELRTPLSPVLLLISAMASDPRLPPDVRGDLATVREHVEVEKRLIGDLLDFSAIHAGKLHMRPVPTDVHDVIRAAIRTCQEDLDCKGLRLDVRLDARHHHALGDPDRLRQVFWNLLQNACKFTPERSAITVRTGDDADGHTLRIEVVDAGRGMDADTLRRVFHPFEQGPRDERTQPYRGLGLGLAISKNLVEAHGGSISASSAGPGHGSTFVVRLPATVPAEPPAPPPAPPKGVPTTPSHLKLLLVEDHPPTLKTLARLLTADGHKVTTAMSVAEALRCADGDRFDLVLSDLGLPDGSGLELMPLLRDRYHLPGVALSGYGADGDVEASTKAGFLAHATKPVTLETLREILTRCADAPAPNP